MLARQHQLLCARCGLADDDELAQAHGACDEAVSRLSAAAAGELAAAAGSAASPAEVATSTASAAGDDVASLAQAVARMPGRGDS